MHIVVKLDYPPEDIERIEKIVRDNVSFVAFVEGDIFSLFNYLNPLSRLKFRAVGDLNFTEKIASLANGEFSLTRNLTPYRWAAAVLAFCQLGGIDFDFDSSLLEFASVHGPQEAREKYAAFHFVNNIDTHFLVDFALERSGSIPAVAFSGVPIMDRIPEEERLSRKGNYFHINYVFVLKIALLSRELIEPHRKMMKLIDWMHKDFMFSGPAFHFANLYFSPSRIGGMLKNLKKEGIQNSAWDLTHLLEWSKIAITEGGIGHPLLLITGDKAVKKIAECLVGSDYEEFKSHFISPWGKKSGYGKLIFEHYSDRLSHAQSDQDRQRKSYALLSRMKKSLERQLFG